ncbi:protein SSUH2 homolog [Littorina saxatilis]|uniref:Protein SSUH2 homolog n=1 Tax=Littorina saxatilis TaxID=31220 RepID=A0AAN9GCC1_9CAEN
MATGGGMMPGAPNQPAQPWRPGQGGPPPNTNDGDSEGDSGDEGPSEPQKFNDVNIPNYGNMGPVGQMSMLPPPPPPPAPSGPPPDMRFTEISVMGESDCRDAIIQFQSEHCCYGSAAAKEMVFSSCVPMTALHYTLETYAEARSTGYKSKPYRGEFVDGPENGQPPPPWAVPCEADQLFKNQVKLFEVPHTSFVKQCHGCRGRGWNQCRRCHGRGRVRCGACNGRGRKQVCDHEGNMHWHDCHSCQGGVRRCHQCGGDGRVTCRTCEGFGQLRAYVELKVEYKNHNDDYILEQTDMPDELIRDVGGKPVFEQTMPQVWPIMAYPVAEVNSNSQNLVEHHRRSFNDERKLMQRQILRAVPVTEVKWDWKDNKGRRFWAYGNERRVYCPDYPQQCCWGCEIL